MNDIMACINLTKKPSLFKQPTFPFSSLVRKAIQLAEQQSLGFAVLSLSSSYHLKLTVDDISTQSCVNTCQTSQTTYRPTGYVCSSSWLLMHCLIWTSFFLKKQKLVCCFLLKLMLIYTVLVSFLVPSKDNKSAALLVNHSISQCSKKYIVKSKNLRQH